MGDSKRRKKLDPNYGKNQPLKSELIHDCNSLIAQESVLLVLDYWSDVGGVALIANDVDSLKDSILVAYNFARQKSAIDLGIRRQKEHSLGFISLMDRHFRHDILQLKDEGDGMIVFNWYNEAEIEEGYKYCQNAGKGKVLIFKIMYYLIHNCNRDFQFPCWISGIKIRDSNTFVDLILVCDRRNQYMEKNNIVILGENYK